MTVGGTFPRAAAQNRNLLDWTANFSWGASAAADVVEILLHQLIAEQEHGPAAFHAFAEALRDDLVAATALNPADPNVAAARFVIAAPPAHVCLTEGREGVAWDWVHWAVSGTHVFGARVNHGEHALPPYRGATAPMNRLAWSMVLDWIEAAYLVARRLGGMDALARHFAPSALAVIIREIGCGQHVAAVPALTAVANWATKDRDPVEPDVVHAALKLFRGGRMPERQLFVLGSIFVTDAARLTDRNSVEWSRLLLTRFAPILDSQELLQLRVGTIDSLDAWLLDREKVLDGITTLTQAARAAAADEISAIQALEARVDIIHPLVALFVKEGSVDDVMDVLRAWYSGEAPPCDADVLFVSPAHSTGVTYLWPGGRWTVNSPDDTGLEEMLRSISTALGDYFRGPEGDREVQLDEARMGQPIFDQGPALRDRVRAHYALDSLPEHLPADLRMRSVVAFPALRDPLQALLQESLGWLAPMEASMAAASPRRAIGTIGIWPGFTYTTEAEIECLRRVALDVGWNVRVVEGVLDADAFRRFYEDASLDVAWVIGHGEQSAYDAAATGLVLDDRTLLPMGAISAMRIPNGGRRLLVLNICSSGATQIRGGLARVGFGHGLASPVQEVVAHLWPIDEDAALAFGSGFALALAKQPPEDALATALLELRDLPRLVDKLREIDADLRVVRRLETPELADRMANVLNWGCPVLLT